MTIVTPPDFSQVMAHEIIAETAKNMARETYVMWARQNNEWFKNHPSEEEWVQKSWGLYVEAARTTLAMLLGQPSVPDLLKAQIHDALVKDNSVRRGRTLQVDGLPN
jgi:hypothetical protein